MGGRLIQRTWRYEPRSPAPQKYRRACTYEAYVPDPLEGLDLSLDGELAGVVSEAEAAVQRLNALARPALAPLARLLLRTESIASSKVEGMQVGARQLARAEAKLETGDKAGGTAVEILANIDAMQLAIDEATAASRFGRSELEAIHARLMERAPGSGVAGRVREEQNWIGGNDYNPCGADFVPPPPEFVADLLDDLFDALNDDRLPPLVQAALVHAQFETIHPFHDGNGRTGRALIHVVLHRRGIAPDYAPPISVVLANGRDRYIGALTGYREDEIPGWIDHFAAATTTAAELASGYLEAVAELAERWRTALESLASPPRSDAAAWAIIDVLPAHPIITAPVAAAATGRAKPRVYQGIESLEEAGVLIPLSQKRRNQSWEAAGLLPLLERLEAGVPPDQ
ncbi:MAG: Fic family protein [Candidatus Longimicrobiales bacterium M2_2A_002]